MHRVTSGTRSRWDCSWSRANPVPLDVVCVVARRSLTTRFDWVASYCVSTYRPDRTPAASSNTLVQNFTLLLIMSIKAYRYSPRDYEHILLLVTWSPRFVHVSNFMYMETPSLCAGATSAGPPLLVSRRLLQAPGRYRFVVVVRRCYSHTGSWPVRAKPRNNHSNRRRLNCYMYMSWM